jgi:hypothetical protein
MLYRMQHGCIYKGLSLLNLGSANPFGASFKYDCTTYIVAWYSVDAIEIISTIVLQ